MTTGYIYCFSNESMKGVYKIGYTKRTPTIRLNEANCSDTWRPPSQYVLEFAKKVDNPQEKEKMIHKLLENFNTRVSNNREFFRTSLEIIRNIFTMIEGTMCDNKSTTPEDLLNVIDEESIQDNLEDNKIPETIKLMNLDITPSFVDSKYITCSVCSKIYSTKKSYNRHIQLNKCKEHDMRGIHCKYCLKVFTRNHNKNLHEDKCEKNPIILLNLKTENEKMTIKLYEAYQELHTKITSEDKELKARIKKQNNK